MSGDNKKKAAVLLFSGGRDSSLATLQLVKEGYEIHLLTFDNGTTKGIDISNFRLQELESILKDNLVERKIINSRELFKEIALKQIEGDLDTFGTNLICMGCKMAMHAISLNYCLKNDIKVIADGYTYYQREWPEQMPEAIKEIKEFHRKYGVKYINPVYDIKTKEEAKKRLSNHKLSIDSLEGSCIFGGTFSTPEESNVVDYIKSKLNVCESYLKTEQLTPSYTEKEDAILISSCLLNQFMRAKGAAKYKKNLYVPLFEWASERGIAILPLPCPEYLYEGIIREASGLEKYDTEVYREHCKSLSKEVADLVKAHIGKGVNILGVLGINGSPSCGVSYSTKENKDIEILGIFFSELKNKLRELKFIGIDLSKKDYEFELFKELGELK